MGLPLPAPSSVPTPCGIQHISGPEDFDLTIDEDDCKIWNVTGPIKSLTARRQRV